MHSRATRGQSRAILNTYCATLMGVTSLPVCMRFAGLLWFCPHKSAVMAGICKSGILSRVGRRFANICLPASSIKPEVTSQSLIRVQVSAVTRSMADCLCELVGGEGHYGRGHDDVGRPPRCHLRVIPGN